VCGIPPLAFAAAACFALQAQANPTGPKVVNGQVSFQQSGNLLQVTNSPGSIINWQSFSIGANEITRFVQQSASSSVLNRVTALNNPSSILGTLQSNGRVFVLNPSGIVFGAGSKVDVAGLLASSLNLSNADFLAGRLNFTATPGAGSVINQGSINTGPAGHVYLVGPAVTNSGIITSPKGEVVLAAGNTVELVNPGTPNLRVEISAPDNQAVNLGQISADAGRVGIYAGLINHSGTIRADSAELTPAGQIILKATKSLALDAGSRISATGANGADGGFIETSGETLAIDPAAAVTARSEGGKAGTWLIDPVDITIAHASGGAGSGTIAPTTNASIPDGQINATLDGGTSVVIQTSGGSTGLGDITMDGAASILNSSGGAVSLTLNADRHVVLNAGATISGSSGNPLTVALNANVGGAGVGNVEMQAGSSITTSGGNIVITGVALNGVATLNSGTGTIQVTTTNSSGTGTGSVLVTGGVVSTGSGGGSLTLTSLSGGSGSTGGSPGLGGGAPGFGGGLSTIQTVYQNIASVVTGINTIGNLLGGVGPYGRPGSGGPGSTTSSAAPNCSTGKSLSAGACSVR
jgi:filamentous hemagglutinin family protein